MTTKNEMLKYVRQFCSECMGGPRATEGAWPIPNPGLVQGCTANECIWFEFRDGTDPNPSAARVNMGKALVNRMRNSGCDEAPSDVEENAEESTIAQ